MDPSHRVLPVFFLPSLRAFHLGIRITLACSRNKHFCQVDGNCIWMRVSQMLPFKFLVLRVFGNMPALTQFWGSSADFMLFLYVGGGDGDAIGISDPDISITYLLLSKLKCKNINSLN